MRRLIFALILSIGVVLGEGLAAEPLSHGQLVKRQLKDGPTCRSEHQPVGTCHDLLKNMIESTDKHEEEFAKKYIEQEKKCTASVKEVTDGCQVPLTEELSQLKIKAKAKHTENKMWWPYTDSDMTAAAYGDVPFEDVPKDCASENFTTYVKEALDVCMDKGEYVRVAGVYRYEDMYIWCRMISCRKRAYRLPGSLKCNRYLGWDADYLEELKKYNDANGYSWPEECVEAVAASLLSHTVSISLLLACSKLFY